MLGIRQTYHHKQAENGKPGVPPSPPSANSFVEHFRGSVPQEWKLPGGPELGQ